MGKVIEEYTSQYDVGDVVVFSNSSRLFLVIIEGQYIDHNCGNSFWYNVRVNSNTVYTYSNHGDIAEWDIAGKLDNELKEKCYERSTKLTAPCSLCNEGQVRINSISTMNITSQWATYDVGRLDKVNFCPKCGKRLLGQNKRFMVELR